MNADAQPWDYTQPEITAVRQWCADCGQWRLGDLCYVCHRPLTGPASGRP